MAQSRLPLLVTRETRGTLASFTLVGQLNRERSILEGDGGFLPLETDGLVGTGSFVFLESLQPRRRLDGCGDVDVTFRFPQRLVAGRTGGVGRKRLLVGRAIQPFATRLPYGGIGRCVRHAYLCTHKTRRKSNPSW